MHDELSYLGEENRVVWVGVLLGKLVHRVPHPSWCSSLNRYLNEMASHRVPGSSVTEK